MSDAYHKMFWIIEGVFSMSDREEAQQPSPDPATKSPDEIVVEWILLIAMPFLIGFITWGVIILAFSGWKLR